MEAKILVNVDLELKEGIFLIWNIPSFTRNFCFHFENPTMIHTAINPCQLFKLEQALEKILYIFLQTEWLESLPKHKTFFRILIFRNRHYYELIQKKRKNNFLRLLTLFNMGSCLLTCVSDKLRVLASSFRSAPTTYWFFSNACSNFSSWLGLKAVRILFGFRNGSKNSGKWGPRIIRVENILICL